MKRAMVGALTIAFAMLLTVPSQGQGKVAGVFGGVNLANTGGTDGGGDDSRTGFNAGVFGEWGLHRNFGIGLAGYYSQQGAKDSTTGSDAQVKIDYINIQLNLVGHIPTGEGSMIAPWVHAGPYVGFNVNCSDDPGGGAASTDCDDLLSSTDFGLGLGAGIGFNVGSGQFFIGGQYMFSLSSIVEDVGTTSVDVKNQVIQFFIGYGFNLGGGGM